MNTLKRFSFALALAAILVAVVPSGFAQTALLNTTLSTAIDDKTQLVTLAAVTNITAAGNPISTSAIGTPSGTALWLAYIDKEAMEIVSLSSTTLTVRRGRQGTRATAHNASVKVLAGPVSAFTTFDPIGTCTRTALKYVPVVNVLNGSVNDCTAGAWSNFTTNPGTGTVIASQAGSMTGAYAILAKVTHISGTSAIVTMDVPAGVFPGNSFTLIPDAAFTGTTAGNIAKAFTAVLNQALTFTWDGTKLIPSY